MTVIWNTGCTDVASEERRKARGGGTLRLSRLTDREWKGRGVRSAQRTEGLKVALTRLYAGLVLLSDRGD